jgi:hypothetical protein
MQIACALPLPVFKQLMERDDLVCQSEADVLDMIETYIVKSTIEIEEKMCVELLECVRFDKLEIDRLIQLSKSNLTPGIK